MRINRVLTLDEVQALPEGAEVYAEERSDLGVESGVRKREGYRLMDEDGCGYNLRSDEWYLFSGRVDVRIWSLPQPPTEAELAANPWEVVANSHIDAALQIATALEADINEVFWLE